MVLGRHSRCDLVLDQDASVSLRHAVVMASASGDELRVRIMDLRSGSGFATEDGVTCESLSADGALFVRLGGFHLFLMPTGSLAPLPWEPSAIDTWSAFPDRVYRDSRAPMRAPAEMRARAPAVGSGRNTVVTSILEPPGTLRAPRSLPGDHGPAVGSIALSAQGGGAETHVVHSTELERGLLVGRYERCELGVSDDTLSRVHLLLVRRDDEVWAIDTASSNGTTFDGKRVRQARLQRDAEVVLAKAVSVRWSSASGQA
jgi:FHA domain